MDVARRSSGRRWVAPIIGRPKMRPARTWRKKKIKGDTGRTEGLDSVGAGFVTRGYSSQKSERFEGVASVVAEETTTRGGGSKKQDDGMQDAGCSGDGWNADGPSGSDSNEIHRNPAKSAWPTGGCEKSVLANGGSWWDWAEPSPWWALWKPGRAGCPLSIPGIPKPTRFTAYRISYLAGPGKGRRHDSSVTPTVFLAGTWTRARVNKNHDSFQKHQILACSLLLHPVLLSLPKRSPKCRSVAN